MDPFLHQHPKFSIPKFELFDLMNPKILTSQISSLSIIPNPKSNQKSPKDPKLILILTMKLLYTYFWKTLPIGDLIWVTPIWLAFSKSSQITQPTSNHLKSKVAILNQKHSEKGTPRWSSTSWVKWSTTKPHSVHCYLHKAQSQTQSNVYQQCRSIHAKIQALQTSPQQHQRDTQGQHVWAAMKKVTSSCAHPCVVWKQKQLSVRIWNSK